MKEYTVKVDEKGTKYWCLNGLLHRIGGPAVEYPDGEKHWCLNGLLHREDGPAIEFAGGAKAWYLNGLIYSEENYWKQLENA